jgi:hypothetical protein
MGRTHHEVKMLDKPTFHQAAGYRKKMFIVHLKDSLPQGLSHPLTDRQRETTAKTKQLGFTVRTIVDRCGNDPSAGSPTETLLRLHLPLNDKV